MFIVIILTQRTEDDAMEIKICIGSACHLKGSYDVIKKCQNYIKEHNLSDTIELKSAFCLGRCSEAVSVQVNATEIFSISPETAEGFMKLMHQRTEL